MPIDIPTPTSGDSDPSDAFKPLTDALDMVADAMEKQANYTKRNNFLLNQLVQIQNKHLRLLQTSANPATGNIAALRGQNKNLKTNADLFAKLGQEIRDALGSFGGFGIIDRFIKTISGFAAAMGIATVSVKELAKIKPVKIKDALQSVRMPEIAPVSEEHAPEAVSSISSALTIIETKLKGMSSITFKELIKDAESLRNTINRQNDATSIAIESEIEATRIYDESVAAQENWQRIIGELNAAFARMTPATQGMIGSFQDLVTHFASDGETFNDILEVLRNELNDFGTHLRNTDPAINDFEREIINNFNDLKQWSRTVSQSNEKLRTLNATQDAADREMESLYSTIFEQSAAYDKNAKAVGKHLEVLQDTIQEISALPASEKIFRIDELQKASTEFESMLRDLAKIDTTFIDKLKEANPKLKDTLDKLFNLKQPRSSQMQMPQWMKSIGNFFGKRSGMIGGAIGAGIGGTLGGPMGGMAGAAGGAVAGAGIGKGIQSLFKGVTAIGKKLSEAAGESVLGKSMSTLTSVAFNAGKSLLSLGNLVSGLLTANVASFGLELKNTLKIASAFGNIIGGVGKILGKIVNTILTPFATALTRLSNAADRLFFGFDLLGMKAKRKQSQADTVGELQTDYLPKIQEALINPLKGLPAIMKEMAGFVNLVDPATAQMTNQLLESMAAIIGTVLTPALQILNQGLNGILNDLVNSGIIQSLQLALAALAQTVIDAIGEMDFETLIEDLVNGVAQIVEDISAAATAVSTVGKWLNWLGETVKWIGDGLYNWIVAPFISGIKIVLAALEDFAGWLGWFVGAGTKGDFSGLSKAVGEAKLPPALATALGVEEENKPKREALKKRDRSKDQYIPAMFPTVGQASFKGISDVGREMQQRAFTAGYTLERMQMSVFSKLDQLLANPQASALVQAFTNERKPFIPARGGR